MSGLPDLTNLSTQQLEQALAQKKQADAEEKAQKRKEYEELEHQTATEVLGIALMINATLKSAKKTIFSDLKAFGKIRREFADLKPNDKGSFKIHTADKRGRIQFSMQSEGYFDDTAELAEEHIMQFIEEEFGDNEAKDFILSALSKTKGKLDIKLVQRLYKLEDNYSNPKWKKGIELLKQAWQQTDSKLYVRIYKKDSEGKYQMVVTNFSSISIDD